MRLDQPPGCRSCMQSDPDDLLPPRPGSGGDWVFACDGEASEYITQDMASLGYLSFRSRQMLGNELTQKLKQANVGRLVYGHHADVEWMKRSANILEIRLSGYAGLPGEDGDPKLFQVRLYFTEPAEAPGYFILLGLRAKIPGEVGVAEQEQHIAEMEERLREFEMGLARCDIPLGLYCLRNVREEFRA